MNNQCVPVKGVLPHLYYSDVDLAVNWLQHVFSFRENYRVPEDNGRIHVAQLYLEEAYVMVRNARKGQISPTTAHGVTQSLMIIVNDVDAHYAHALASGAQISSVPTDQMYGEREYSTVDLDGHQWTFSQHIADIDPHTIFPPGPEPERPTE